MATAWAWLPLQARGGEPDCARLANSVMDEGGCRVAVGLTGIGVDGFRRSHEQALAARRVASSVDVPVMSYGDEGVAVTAMLSTDLDGTRAWIAAVLGPLARDADQAAALRETLRGFHACGESYTATADIMNMHRSTVRYRISRAQKSLDIVGSPARTDLRWR
ncbi:PucR family transcriptional regulator [Nocardioides sp. WG-D5]